MTRKPSATTIDAIASSRGQAATLRTGIFWIHPERRFDAFARSKTRFGRADECDHRLSGDQVSRTHAQLLTTGDGYVLNDANSRNGTFVNRTRVSETRLQTQDVVRIGNWVGVVLELTAQDQPITQVLEHVFLGPAATQVYVQAVRASHSQLSIIICGETGTGKEVLSTAIHRSSGRAGKLVAVNCAALPEALAEGELFGYRKGAFTGAAQSSLGHFRSAHRGTLLLDEVVELPLSVQAKLLRALEERTVVPLGESHPIAVDARVVSAGQGALSAAVAAGRFRSDLYARLRGVELHLPPLRARREEICVVFLDQAQQALNGRIPKLSPDLVEALCTYHWPMNVREVVQVARQLAVLHPDQATWTSSLLPAPLRDPRPSSLPSALLSSPAERRSEAERLRHEETERLIHALEQTGGNLSQAAAALNISRQRAYRLLQSRPNVNLDRLRTGQ